MGGALLAGLGGAAGTAPAAAGGAGRQGPGAVWRGWLRGDGAEGKGHRGPRGAEAGAGAGVFPGARLGTGGCRQPQGLQPPPQLPGSGHPGGCSRRSPRSDLRQMLAARSVENIQFLPFLTTDVKYGGVEPGAGGPV